MLKVLIVEDEPIEREAVNMILAGMNGYKTVGEAADGEEALAKARLLCPDIVLMDIRIGKVSGLEVCRIIRSEFLNVEIIIISAYDRFDYSRQALRAGAFDFLVKPVEPNTLIESLERAKEKIFKTRSQNTVQNSLKEQVSGFLIPFLLQDVFSPTSVTLNMSELKGLFAMLGLEEGQTYVALIIKCIAEKCPTTVKKNLADFLPSGYKIIITPIFDDKILVFISHEQDKLTNDSLRKLVYDLASFLAAHNRNHKFQIGVGRIYVQVSNLVRSIKEAVTTLQIAEIMNTPDLLFYLDLDTKAYKDSLSEIYEKLQNVSELVQKAEFKPALKQIRALSLENIAFREQNEVSELIRLLAYEIMLFALQTMNARSASEKNAGLLKSNWHSQWKKCSSLLDLMQWLATILKMVGEVQNRHDEIGDERVIKAIEFMEGNYSRDISLVSISQQINISAQYLSRLFKIKAGLTFADYLNKIRIDAAKKMLIDAKSCPVKKIALDIGYSSDIYFAFVFKKITRMTPKEYREQNNR